MNELRDLFYIRPDIVFLNHGSFGACPRPVFEAYQTWQIELERQPVEFLGRRFRALMHESRYMLGRFLGTSGENIVFVPNATTGLNMVARSLPLKEDDEILTTDHEYGAMNRMWESICRRRGAHYIRQSLPLPVESTDQAVETIWSGVTKRTRVLFISHITSPTALIFPVKELAKRARETGIIMMVDGAHVPGQLSLRLDLLDVDFYAGNFHKWLMAPKGSAFLYAHPNVQKLLDPLIVSWGDQSLGNSSFIQENEYQGTRDIAAYLATPTAIEFAQRHNWPDVQRKCHELVVHARRKLAEITELSPISPESDKWFNQMAAHPLPECDGELLKKRLYDEFSVEIPIFENNGERFIRISVQGYNTRDDVEYFLNVFAELLKDYT